MSADLLWHPPHPPTQGQFEVIDISSLLPPLWPCLLLLLPPFCLSVVVVFFFFYNRFSHVSEGGPGKVRGSPWSFDLLTARDISLLNDAPTPNSGWLKLRTPNNWVNIVQLLELKWWLWARVWHHQHTCSLTGQILKREPFHCLPCVISLWVFVRVPTCAPAWTLQLPDGELQDTCVSPINCLSESGGFTWRYERRGRSVTPPFHPLQWFWFVFTRLPLCVAIHRRGARTREEFGGKDSLKANTPLR